MMGKYSAGTAFLLPRFGPRWRNIAPVGFDERAPAAKRHKKQSAAALKLGVAFSGVIPKNTNSVPRYPHSQSGKAHLHDDENRRGVSPRMQDKESGYGYRYCKGVQLAPSKPHLTIAHVCQHRQQVHRHHRLQSQFPYAQPR